MNSLITILNFCVTGLACLTALLCITAGFHYCSVLIAQGLYIAAALMLLLSMAATAMCALGAVLAYIHASTSE